MEELSKTTEDLDIIRTGGLVPLSCVRVRKCSHYVLLLELPPGNQRISWANTTSESVRADNSANVSGAARWRLTSRSVPRMFQFVEQQFRLKWHCLEENVFSA